MSVISGLAIRTVIICLAPHIRTCRRWLAYAGTIALISCGSNGSGNSDGTQQSRDSTSTTSQLEPVTIPIDGSRFDGIGNGYSYFPPCEISVAKPQFVMSNPNDGTVVLSLVAQTEGPSETIVGVPLLIRAIATGSGLTHRWDFGDGETSTATDTVLHTYRIAGTYSATVTVTDSNGRSAVASVPISVRSSGIALLAGHFGGKGNQDGIGANASFDYPTALAVDNLGNVFVSDYNNRRIAKIAPDATVTTLVRATNARTEPDPFSLPLGIALDSAGNVFLADMYTHVVRKISIAGVVSTFAGAVDRYGSADGPAAQARFHSPNGVAIDSADNVYVADRNNSTIRKITPQGIVTTLAGKAGVSGNIDGPGSDARFSMPMSIAIDRSGNLYVADALNRSVRKVTATGLTSTIAGADDNICAMDGPAELARFTYPHGIAVDRSGVVYVSDPISQIIRKISPSGLVTTLAGSPGVSGGNDGVGSAARFSFPHGLATDAAGNVFVADAGNSKVRRITPSGLVSTIAGGTDDYFLSEAVDGPGANGRFAGPIGITGVASGEVFVADGSAIRGISAAGFVSTFAGSTQQSDHIDGVGDQARFKSLIGLSSDGSANLFVSDYFDCSVRKISAGAEVTTVLRFNSLLCGDSSNDPVIGSTIGVAVNQSGSVLISDSARRSLLSIAPTGTVTTRAVFEPSTTYEAATVFGRFQNDMGIALDAGGSVYLADGSNHVVRRISTAGVVSTVAGKNGSFGYVDGNASDARFDTPQSVAVAPSGNVYVADTGNAVVRKITPAGDVSTVLGTNKAYGARVGALPGSFATIQATHLPSPPQRTSGNCSQLPDCQEYPGRRTVNYAIRAIAFDPQGRLLITNGRSVLVAVGEF